MRTIAAVIALVLATSPALAANSGKRLSRVADPGKPRPLSPSANREAKQHYERGMAHYRLGEFALAVEEFKQAYALSQAPGLLFNLAQASRLAKDYEQALHFYRTYLRVLPDASNAEDVQNRIADLEPLVDSKRDRGVAAAKPVRPEPAPAPVEPPPAPVESPRSAALAAQPPRAPVDYVTDNGKPIWTAGVVIGALGVAALGTGVGFGVAAMSQQKRLSALSDAGDPWPPNGQEVYDIGARNAKLATALLVGGGVLAGTGLVLGLIGWRKSRAHFAMAPLKGGAHMGVTCDF